MHVHSFFVVYILIAKIPHEPFEVSIVPVELFVTGRSPRQMADSIETKIVQLHLQGHPRDAICLAIHTGPH
jgi:hypothetical protein